MSETPPVVDPAPEGFVSLPGGATLLQFLGWAADDELTAQADIHAQNAALTVHAYVRGVGFDGGFCAVELAAVVQSVAARMLNNPTQDRRVKVGNLEGTPGYFAGFTLGELAILNRFRLRAG